MSGDLLVLRQPLLRTTFMTLGRLWMPRMTLASWVNLDSSVSSSSTTIPIISKKSTAGQTEQNGYELVLTEGNFDSIWKQQPKVVDLGQRKQGEGISYTPDGRSLNASSERKDAPIIRVTRR